MKNKRIKFYTMDNFYSLLAPFSDITKKHGGAQSDTSAIGQFKMELTDWSIVLDILGTGQI